MEATMTETLLDHALKYAKRGVPVFPLKPRGKLPLTVKGFKDATTDERQIRAWWDRWPDANIGVPTGTTAGDGGQLLVIDFDQPGFLEAWSIAVGEWADEVTLQRTGEGHQVLLRCPGAGPNQKLAWIPSDNPANKDGREIAIETRGVGGYIVAAPSIHPNGRQYTVVKGQIEDAPEATQAKADAMLVEASKLDQCPLTRKQQEQLAAAEPRYKQNGETANGKASVIDAFNVAHNVVDVLLHHGYQRRGKDRLIRPGAETTSTPGVWLTERNGRQVSFHHSSNDPLNDGHTHDAFSVFCHFDHDDNVREAVKAAAKLLGLDREPRTEFPEVKLPEFLPAEQAEEHVERAPAIPQATFPPQLLSPPGFLGELCTWINETAVRPQPILALANALAFCGALYGRKVRTPSNLRTNLYCIGVADSGAGKNHSLSSIIQLCEVAGIPDYLGGEDLGSGTALFNAVHDQPAILFQFDEIGHMLSQVNSKYAAPHLREIPVMFTKLFSKAWMRVRGKEYADRRNNQRRDIDQPNACLYGATSPQDFYNSLTPAEIRNGFLGRLLLFRIDDPDPEPRHVEHEGVPEPLIDHVRNWHLRDDLPKAKGNIASTLNNIAFRVPIEPGAKTVFARFGAESAKRKRAARDGSGIDSLWARAEEHALKVALTIAAGMHFELADLAITPDVAEYAVSLINHVIGDMDAIARRHVAGSDYERNLIALENLISDCGADGITLTRLGVRFRKVNPRDLQQLLEHLLGSGAVVSVKRKSARGPAANTYVSKNNYPENNYPPERP
jgi:hypothetical protein